MKNRSTVICRRHDEILLVRHRLRWALPGGSVRADETPLQCARRELEEETSLVASTMIYLWQFGGLNKRHHVFLVGIDATAQVQAQNEIRACRWFSACDVGTLLVSVPTREILDLALLRHEGHGFKGTLSPVFDHSGSDRLSL